MLNSAPKCMKTKPKIASKGSAFSYDEGKLEGQK